MLSNFEIDYERLADAIASRLSPETAAVLEWTHIDKAAEQLGVTKHVIKGWFENHLRRGVHYQVIGHQTLINTTRLNDWLTEFGKGNAPPAPTGTSPKVPKVTLPGKFHKVTSPHRRNRP